MHTHTHTLPSGDTANEVTVSSSYKHMQVIVNIYLWNQPISLLPNTMLLDQYLHLLPSHQLHMQVLRDPHSDSTDKIKTQQLSFNPNLKPLTSIFPPV